MGHGSLTGPPSRAKNLGLHTTDNSRHAAANSRHTTDNSKHPSEKSRHMSRPKKTYKKIQNPDNITKQQIYNRIKKVIDHENWYSNEQINLIQNKSKELLFFTKNL